MPNPRDVLYRKMAGRGGWAHLDLADALKVMEKEKTFHIATIKWLIVLYSSGDRGKCTGFYTKSMKASRDKNINQLDGFNHNKV